MTCSQKLDPGEKREREKKNQGVAERALGKESKVVVSSSRSTTC